jgi:hypothetical protein
MAGLINNLDLTFNNLTNIIEDTREDYGGNYSNSPLRPLMGALWSKKISDLYELHEIENIEIYDYIENELGINESETTTETREKSARRCYYSDCTAAAATATCNINVWSLVILVLYKGSFFFFRFCCFYSGGCNIVEGVLLYFFSPSLLMSFDVIAKEKPRVTVTHTYTHIGRRREKKGEKNRKH